ncbi:hypothetical protein P9112_008264 [Eukaryota sp. TZLM1-RC]
MQLLAKLIVKSRLLLLFVFLLLTAASIHYSSYVVVNYSSSSYLPPDSETSIALNIVRGEYVTPDSISVMVSYIDKTTSFHVLSKLETISDIEHISFNPHDESYYQNRNARYSVTLTPNTRYETTIKSIRETLDHYHVSLAGGPIDSMNEKEALSREMTLIIGSCVAILFVILTFMSTSYLHTFVFGVTCIIGIILNSGTNALFDDISYITNSISAILQLGLSMDYSVILLNRYKDELCQHTSPKDAMISALSSTMIPITSSSFTTIAGMLALTAMEYTMGRDIGLVLAKGIVCSLVAVFFVMPSLLVCLHSWCEKTKKKALKVDGKVFVYFGSKLGYLTLILTIVLVSVSFFVQSNNSYAFTDYMPNEERDAVEALFGSTETVMALYRTEGVDTFTTERKLINLIDDYVIDGDYVLKSQLSLSTTVYQPLKSDDLSNQMNLEYETSKILFGMYYLENDQSHQMNVKQFVSVSHGLTNRPDIEASIPTEEKDQLRQVNLILTNLDRPLTITQASLMTGIPLPLMTAIYSSYYIDNVKEGHSWKEQLVDIVLEGVNLVRTIVLEDLLYYILEMESKGALPMDGTEKNDFHNTMVLVAHQYSEFNHQQMSIVSGVDNNLVLTVYAAYFTELGVFETNSIPSGLFVRFLDSQRRHNELIAAMMKPEDHMGLDELVDQIDMVEYNLKGKTTQRMILDLQLPSEGQNTWDYIDFLRESMQKTFGSESWIAGSTVANKDTFESFTSDLLKINAITVVSIVLLVGLAFVSVSIPLILIIVIQGAIWFSMSISYFLGDSVFFLSYLVIIAIQMGSSVDYAILLTSEYLSARKLWSKKAALNDAIANALPTILTSGLILMFCGLSVSYISTQKSVQAVGSLLARGTVVSMAFVVVLLPGILYVCDALIGKTTVNSKFISTDAQNLDHY